MNASDKDAEQERQEAQYGLGEDEEGATGASEHEAEVAGRDPANTNAREDAGPDWRSADSGPEHTHRGRSGSAPHENDVDLIETYNDLKNSLEGPFPRGRVVRREFAPDEVAEWEDLPDIQRPPDNASWYKRRILSESSESK